MDSTISSVFHSRVYWLSLRLANLPCTRVVFNAVQIQEIILSQDYVVTGETEFHFNKKFLDPEGDQLYDFLVDA